MTRRRFDRIPEIKSVMTPFPWFVEMDEPLVRAKALLVEHDIRHLAVTEGVQLVGVVSDRDLRAAESTGRGVTRRNGLRVRDACVRDVYVADLNTPLDRVLVEMARRHIDLALVVKNGRLAGIFTATDVCRVFSEFLQAMFPRGGDDEAA